LALGGGGCHIISGASDYDTSFAVGDWQASRSTLGHTTTLTLLGDGTGSAVIPYLDVEKKQLYDFTYDIDWTAASETHFDLQLVCTDAICDDTSFPAHCRALADGAQLSCNGKLSVRGTDEIFERTP